MTKTLLAALPLVLLACGPEAPAPAKRDAFLGTYDMTVRSEYVDPVGDPPPQPAPEQKPVVVAKGSAAEDVVLANTGCRYTAVAVSDTELRIDPKTCVVSNGTYEVASGSGLRTDTLLEVQIDGTLTYTDPNLDPQHVRIHYAGVRSAP